MVLFSFSESKHIPLILSGTKSQTTRQPRKPRKNGAKAYSVGELVQLYYQGRQAKSCQNCIIQGCQVRQHGLIELPCKGTNFFGESVITEIIHYTNSQKDGFREVTSMYGHERWMPTFDRLDSGEQMSWAIADGFQGFDEADDWFSKQYGDDWMQRDWDCILWNGQHIARRVA